MTDPVAQDSSGPPPTTDKAGARAVLFSLLGFVAGAGLMVLALHTLNPKVFDSTSAGSQDRTTPMTGPTSSRMSLQQVLDHHIPTDILPGCTPVPAQQLPDSVRDAAYASTVCTAPSEAIQQVQYYSLHDGIAMRDMFVSSMSNAPSPSVAGDCRTSTSWVGYWRSPPDNKTPTVGMVAHEPVSGASGGRDVHLAGTTYGRALCYVNRDGNHEIDWYDNDTHIYASATASAENQATLFKWWKEHAGPFHPRGMGDSASPPASSSGPTPMPSPM